MLQHRLFSVRRGLFTGTHCEEWFLQVLTDEVRVGRLQWYHFMYTKSMAGGPKVHATIRSIDVFWGLFPCNILEIAKRWEEECGLFFGIAGYRFATTGQVTSEC